MGSLYKRTKKSAAGTVREQEPPLKHPILKRVDQLIPRLLDTAGVSKSRPREQDQGRALIADEDWYKPHHPPAPPRQPKYGN